MTKWIILTFAALLLGGCALLPTGPELDEPCEGELSVDEVIDQHWLNRDDSWRMRQSALLELRGRKVPLEGFMMLDLGRQRLHLVAMNEMGLVFFELVVTATDEQLIRALPQLQQQRGLTAGIAGSLRRIYLSPRPRSQDQPRMEKTSLRLWRPLADGDLAFVFDCPGNLRETRQTTDHESWQVVYQDYRRVSGREIPGKVIMNNFHHAVTLTLWQREVTLEP
ncbi:MAG: hypothetical protein R6V33_09575 [Pelovirga sp.]